MGELNFKTCTTKEIREYIFRASPEEIEKSVSKMSHDNISAAISEMNESLDRSWKEKIRAAVIGLNHRPELEVLGKSLTLHQLLYLIDYTLQIEDKHHWKLSPILVGMSHELFVDLLLQATEKELHILQNEGVTEPVQHHLTTLSHEMTSQIEVIDDEIDQFDIQLDNLDVETLNREDIFDLIHQIDYYADFFQKMFEKTNRALAIAWNTNRLDLIESLNKIKDNCHKYTIYGIGFARTETESATGLYAKLGDRLFAIYENPDNPMDPETLRDEEPAIEALVKFSIWYLRDYWKMGLLPSVKRIEDLDMNLKEHSEIERVKHREALFTEAQENLEKVGLKTVRDLKRALIFSKKTLHDYIQEHLVPN